jgi:G6PDH family F420-dependent oxidoreductase
VQAIAGGGAGQLQASEGGISQRIGRRVGFGEIGGYENVPAGDVAFELRAPSGRALAETRERLRNGAHYTVEGARLFTRPETPPAIVMSGLGPHAAALAGRVADGYMHVAPEGELVDAFRAAGGGGKPCYGKLDTCVAADDATARRIAYETWPTAALGGEIGQQLATPEHYEQATEGATEEDVAAAILCSADPERHLSAIDEFARAGFDHVLVQGCGRDQERFVAFYAERVLPRLGATAPSTRPPA